MDNKTNQSPEVSKFSRRKFIQSGIAASPLLMSVKSPVAWGCNNTGGHSSVSVLLSANASTHGVCQSKPKNECYWDKVFNCSPKDSHFAVKKVLEECPDRIQYYSDFNKMFFNSHLLAKHHGWNCEILVSSSSAPCVGDTQRQYKGYILTFRFEKKIRGNWKSVQIPAPVYRLHQATVTAYLNSVFYPFLINYTGDTNYVRGEFYSALDDAASVMAKMLNNGYKRWEIVKYIKRDHTSPLVQFVDKMTNSWA